MNRTYFKTLFSPIKINKLEIKNRIVFPAMHLNYTPEGYITDQMKAFYETRAKGGVGLIVVGGCTIDEVGGGHFMVRLDTDDFIPGMADLANTLHSYNTKVFAQLYHAGRYVASWMINGKTPVSASAVPSRLTNETPKPLTIDEIKQIQQYYVDASLRAKKADMDGIEILASAGYLICQFLSPLTNQRTDEYGGTFENRMRFGIEVYKKIREAVGDDFPITMRLSGSDFVKGSNTINETVEFARRLEQLGIDGFNITGGWHETHVPQLTFSVPEGAFSYLALKVKQTVNVPVIASNRINNPKLAERLINDGWADMVVMGRALIADPMFPDKARKGNLHEINSCIACNQGCFDNIFNGLPATCLVNPIVGREHEIKISKAEESKHVAVIGAGPAGLECAITLARRGHKVDLYEQEEYIGGQFNLASVVPDKEGFYNLLLYYANQIEHTGVKLHLKTAINEKALSSLKADEIVVATGAMPLLPKIEGIEEGIEDGYVVPAWYVLYNDFQGISENIVIIGGGAVGCDVALYLSQDGTINEKVARFLLENDAEDPLLVQQLLKQSTRKIIILEMLDKVGKDIGRSTRWPIMQQLKRRGVKMYTNTKVTKVEDGRVYTESNGQTQVFDAGLIILATGVTSNNPFSNIKDKRIHVIGDANKPAKAIDAIRQGFELALTI
ncbi:MAG: FAD-dependent oxidoreductase [bacterium]